MRSKKNITNFAVKLNDIVIKLMKQKISKKEWELLQALRNFRKTKHNPSWELEIWIDQLVDELKEEDEEAPQ